MHIEFINITTFQGISSDAEHFYAKVARQENYAEQIAIDCGTSFDTCGNDYFGTELKYYPTREEAEKMVLKDNPKKYVDRNNETYKKLKEINIETYMNGTIRFPDIMSILRTARKTYPDAVFYCSFHGSHKEFLRRFLFDENDKIIPEVKELIMGPTEKTNAEA